MSVLDDVFSQSISINLFNHKPSSFDKLQVYTSYPFLIPAGSCHGIRHPFDTLDPLVPVKPSIEFLRFSFRNHKSNRCQLLRHLFYEDLPAPDIVAVIRLHSREQLPHDIVQRPHLCAAVHDSGSFTAAQQLRPICRNNNNKITTKLKSN